jgi:hypothetical protein
MGHRCQLCVLVATVASAALAHAEPSPEAEKLFRDGRALAKQGKLAEACDAFAASNKLDSSVGTLLNLGDCRAKLGQTATAWATFLEAGRLAKKLSDRRGAEADRRAAELEPKLSYMVIQVDAPVADQRVLRDSTVIDPAVFGQPVALDPGTYEVHAEGPGLIAWSHKVTVKPDGARETVRVPKLARAAAPKAPSASSASTTPDASTEPGAPVADGQRDVPASRFTTRRKIALASGGAGVLALGASTLLALQAKSMHDEARKVCPAGEPCRDLAATDKSKQAVSRASVATIVGGMGIAALAAGAVLWIVGAPPESSAVVRIAPTAARDSVGMTVTGSF